MNLAELMKKHPDKKYRLSYWQPGQYIFLRGQTWWKREPTDRHSYYDDIGLTFYQNDWELYKEPLLEITKEHVFRKARLRSGEIVEICGFCSGASVYPVIVYYGNGVRDEHTVNGRFLSDGRESEEDIVEILPEGYND